MKHRKGTKRRALTLLMTCMLSAACAATGVVASAAPYDLNGMKGPDNLSHNGQFYSDYDSLEEVFQAAKELNGEVVAEGAVLVKNDGTLPLNPKQDKISVFGVRSGDLQEGVNGAVMGENAVASTATGLRNAGFTVNPVLEKFYANLSADERAESQEVGIDFRDLPLRTGVFGAEPWTEEMRQDIEQKMGINALNIYGLSEVMGPGVAMECLESKCGMHLWEDHFLPEIIDPVTGEQLPEGEVGELVITTLTKEGIPLIRYRTRDLTSLDYTPCRCGRTHVRLTRIRGRSDDMLIIRGVNVFPQQIEALLMENQNLSPNYQIIVDRQKNLDTMEIQVELTPSVFSDEVRKVEEVRRRIEHDMMGNLGVGAKITLVSPDSLPLSTGKTVRIIDKRSI